MMKLLAAAAAACTLLSSPALAGTIVLTSTGGGALFEGTFTSTFADTPFDFTASLVGPPAGLPVSFSVQFVGESTYDGRFCVPNGTGPTGCSVFSPLSGPVEDFTLASTPGAFTYHLPVGFVTLRGSLAFGPTSGATVSIDGPGSAVPEPAGWAMMLAGFGAVGAALRRRRRATRGGIPSRPMLRPAPAAGR